MGMYSDQWDGPHAPALSRRARSQNKTPCSYEGMDSRLRLGYLAKCKAKARGRRASWGGEPYAVVTSPAGSATRTVSPTGAAGAADEGGGGGGERRIAAEMDVNRPLDSTESTTPELSSEYFDHDGGTGVAAVAAHQQWQQRHRRGSTSRRREQRRGRLGVLHLMNMSASHHHHAACPPQGAKAARTRTPGTTPAHIGAREPARPARHRPWKHPNLRREHQVRECPGENCVLSVSPAQLDVWVRLSAASAS
jgi:hypothetical protein